LYKWGFQGNQYVSADFIKSIKKNISYLNPIYKYSARIGLVANITSLGLNTMDYFSDDTKLSTGRYAYSAASVVFPTTVGVLSTGGMGAGVGILIFAGEKFYDKVLIPSARKVAEEVVQYENSYVDEIMSRAYGQ
jgi:hypothetical protein